MHRTKRCDGVSRRDVMRIGGLSALGLGLGDFFGLRNAHAAALPEAKAKSCILIWLDGGPSHLESFDPKPEAPVEVRGPLESIATNLPGIRVSECLERTAKMMDKLTVIRSMTSPLGEHVLATHYLMTGYMYIAGFSFKRRTASAVRMDFRKSTVSRSAIDSGKRLAAMQSSCVGNGAE